MDNLLRSVCLSFLSKTNVSSFFGQFSEVFFWTKTDSRDKVSRPILGKLVVAVKDHSFAYFLLGVTYHLCLLLRQRLHVKTFQLS